MILASITLPWFLLVIIRYIKINTFFKTAACIPFTGLYQFVIENIIDAIIEQRPFVFEAINMSDWSIYFMDGNIKLLIFIICIALAFIFAIGGVVQMIRKTK